MVHINAGSRFGRLTVGAPDGRDASGQVMWICRCDCGATARVRSYKLRSGHTTSCGCYNRGLQALLHLRHGHRRRQSREYLSWSNAKQRCVNPRSTSYPNYGGRGVRMCQAWSDSFETFFRDMGPRPEGHQIDRVDVNGNYEPGNCRWVPMEVQSNNRRNNHYVEIMNTDDHGSTDPWVRVTLTQAGQLLGASRELVKTRVRRGWPVSLALMLPPTQGAPVGAGATT